MPFFQGDDRFTQNTKARRLVASALDGNLVGVAAVGLWFMAGTDCQNTGSDGVVDRTDLVRILLNLPMAEQLAEELVDVGLWHRPGHACTKCPPVAKGTYLFHEWFQFGYAPGWKVRANRDKRAELKDSDLVAQVWARDCIDPANPNVGRCRYCGVTVKRKDNKSERKPHLDHVDATKANGIRNVVLSCDLCNQKKGNRTLREAGMTLLPSPRSEPVSDDVRHDAGSASESGRAAGPSGAGSSRADEPAGPISDAPESAGRTSTSPNRGDRPLDRSSNGVAAGPSTDAPAAPGGDRSAVDHPPDHSDIAPVSRRYQPDSAVPHGRGHGQGQGQGVGRGLGKGDSAGSPPPAPQPDSPSKGRRRRRRGRSRQNPNHPSPSSPPVNLDAGAPPPGVVGPVGSFGSPWYGWRGPPSKVTDTDCPTHGLPEPCWKCARTEVSE